MKPAYDRIEIRKSTPVVMPLIMLVSIVGVCASVGFAYANLNRDVVAAEHQIQADEQRLNVLEKNQADIAVMRNDVEWLRRNAERNPYRSQ